MKNASITSSGLPVGLLFSAKSLTGALETTQYHGTLLAIEEVNQAGGVQGVPLVAKSVDIGSEPIDYKKATDHLSESEGVRFFFGTNMSNQRKSVLPSIVKRDSLLFYPTLYEGFEYSENCIYTGAAPNQNSVQLARYVLENYGSRILLVGNNYVFPCESNRVMRDLFEEAGGVIVDESYLPIDTPEAQIEVIIDQATALLPDAIYSTVVGSDIVKLYEAFARSPLRRKQVPIFSIATNEADLNVMSSDVTEGHISAAPYFESLNSAESLSFVRRFKDMFGNDAVVTSCAEAAYFQVHLFAKAARIADNLNIWSVLEALWSVDFLAPQGPVKLDQETHHTFLWPRIGRANAHKQFDIVAEEALAVRPEPYMIKHSFRDHVQAEA